MHTLVTLVTRTGRRHRCAQQDVMRRAARIQVPAHVQYPYGQNSSFHRDGECGRHKVSLFRPGANMIPVLQAFYGNQAIT